MYAVDSGLTFSHHTIPTRDGLNIAVHETGRGDPLVYATGIGVHHEGLFPFFEPLSRRYRVITWDYRCMGDSENPEPMPELTMARHALDGLDVMNALAVKKAPMVGWSMGVPVGLEMIRQEPDRFSAYIALFGSPGKPFEAGFPPPAAWALKKMFRVLQEVPEVSQAALGLSQTLPEVAFHLLSGISFVGRSVDRDAFSRQMAGVSKTPQRPYFKTLLNLAEHDANDLLSTLATKSLVIAGNKDWLTPANSARRMARAIPQCELLVLANATHFGLIEQPKEVTGKILEFLEKI